ncbi:MAG TPA: FadR family transcriptional regulator [Firmicutes bacterium]|nr:FadR family transcriptional regulator [Bacillota bacterium]
MSQLPLETGKINLRLAKRPNLTHEVRKRIERYILLHNLKPGDRLPTEMEFCELLGVSRPVVRAAMHTLEEMGLVSVEVGRGTFLNAFDPAVIFANLPISLLFRSENMREVLEVRHYLERLCISRAVEVARENPDHPYLKEMIACAEEMEKRAQADQQMLEEDIRFHQALAYLADNRILHLILDVFWELRRLYPFDNSPGAKMRRALKHRELIESILKGDVENAIRANEQMITKQQEETMMGQGR